jgi:hypothetical protein
MATPNQLSNLNIQNNYVLNGLDSPDKMALVYDLSGGYNTLTMLVDILNKQKSTQVVGLDGKFQKPILGRSNVIAQILANAQAGANLVITFTNPTYDLFRIKDVVLDTNRNQGRVIAKAPGTITIEPLSKPTALVAATHFTAGMFAKSSWDASGNFGSTGKSVIYETPYYDYNYTAITRESAEYFRRNMNSTFVKYEGKYWYTSIDEMAVRNMARQSERKAWMSWRGQTTSSIEGVLNQNGGLEWAIKDPIRGGYVQTQTNNPTKADFENFIMTVSRRQAASNVRLTLLMGQGALANLQTNFTSDFVKFGGVYNTFGGSEVVGLNVMKYAIAGVECDIMRVPFFDDEEFFPEPSTIPNVIGNRMSNTVVALDTAMYPSIGGGMLPAIEKIHFGEKEFIYGYIPGMIGANGADPSTIIQNGYAFAGNDSDKVSFQIYTDSGIDAIGYRMGWMELAS